MGNVGLLWVKQEVQINERTAKMNQITKKSRSYEGYQMGASRETGGALLIDCVITASFDFTGMGDLRITSGAWVPFTLEAFLRIRGIRQIVEGFVHLRAGFFCPTFPPAGLRREGVVVGEKIAQFFLDFFRVFTPGHAVEGLRHFRVQVQSR